MRLEVAVGIAVLVMMTENDTCWRTLGEFLGGRGEGDDFFGVTLRLRVRVGHVLDGNAGHGGVLEFAHCSARMLRTMVMVVEKMNVVWDDGKRSSLK